VDVEILRLLVDKSLAVMAKKYPDEA